MRLEDPRLVREEHASERGPEGRRSAYRYADGPNAPELVFRAVAAAPSKVVWIFVAET